MDSAQVQRLLDAARAVRQNAYAPHSRFAVGAALLCRTGEIVTGVNVENASYGLSICAERVAIAKAVSEGLREFAAMAVVVGGDERPIPCGACCQVLAEFCGPDLPLYLSCAGAEPEVRTLGELLPTPFTLKPRT